MNHPREVRQAIRARRHTGHTAGLAPCPLLAMSRPGDPRLPGLGEDLDIENRSLADS
jgi:uncharacterized protein YcsI (UPF0317 family)